MVDVDENRTFSFSMSSCYAFLLEMQSVLKFSVCFIFPPFWTHVYSLQSEKEIPFGCASKQNNQLREITSKGRDFIVVLPFNLFALLIKAFYRNNNKYYNKRNGISPMLTVIVVFIRFRSVHIISVKKSKLSTWGHCAYVFIFWRCCMEKSPAKGRKKALWNLK